VEMDAYAQGEIAAISQLVHPSLAIVTAVGPQHLERFGTLGRIADAMYEVVAALPNNGTAIVSIADASCVALAHRAAAEHHRVIRYALADDGAPTDADVVASEIRIDAHGGAFRWRWPAERLDRAVTIPLLGRHQVANVTAALTAVHVLGYDLDAAVATAASLPQVEHRLELMATSGPMTVIDDSYNANPVGVHNGLEVLAAMAGGTKFLVTPGLVELGSVEDDENRRYGEHAARVCGHVIVMSAKTSAALCAGLRDGGMSEDRIHIADSLEAATAVLQRLSKPRDVVLFANDLPDTYLPASRGSRARAVTPGSPGG
jgi:UDP-N-acetylmuramoyl-tripeptide--D-alanyl-D-alanine ligase